MVAGQNLMLNKDDYISGIELTHDGNPDRATSSMLVRHMVLNINRQVRMTRLGAWAIKWQYTGKTEEHMLGVCKSQFQSLCQNGHQMQIRSQNSNSTTYDVCHRFKNPSCAWPAAPAIFKARHGKFTPLIASQRLRDAVDVCKIWVDVLGIFPFGARLLSICHSFVGVQPRNMFPERPSCSNDLIKLVPFSIHPYFQPWLRPSLDWSTCFFSTTIPWGGRWF
jgi:hypothetical protein